MVYEETENIEFIEELTAQAGGRRKRRSKSKSKGKKRRSKSKGKRKSKRRSKRKSKSKSKGKKRRSKRRSKRKSKSKSKSNGKKKRRSKRRSKSKSKRRSRKMKRGVNPFIANAVKVGNLTGNKGPVAGMVLKKYADKLGDVDDKYTKAFNAIKSDHNNNKSKLDDIFKKAYAELAKKKKNRKPRKSKK